MRRSAARKFAAARWPEGRLDASLSNSVVTTVGRPSPRASANFRPSALGKPRDTKPCLRRDTKRHFVAARTFLLRRLNSPVPKASDWLNEVSREAARVGVFVRRFRRFSCRGHLTQTEGRDDAAATGEGRLVRAVPVKADWTTTRPSSHGVDASSQAALAARQMRRGSWFAPVGAVSAANTHIRQYMRSAQMLAIAVFLHKSRRTLGKLVRPRHLRRGGRL